MMFRIIFFLFLLVQSGFAAADDYPAFYGYRVSTYYATTASGVCDLMQSSAGGTYNYTFVDPLQCKKSNATTGQTVTFFTIFREYFCPYGGSLTGTWCTGANSCPSPQTRNPTTGQCEDPPQVNCPGGGTAPTLAQCPTQCTSPQYDLNGTCTNPPDCNATWPTGGQYFDYTTKTCMGESEHTGCIGSNDKYCPPIADCKPASYICTNDSDAVNQATLARSAAFAAAKARADEAAAKAAAAASAAEKAAAARTQEHDRLTALKSAAKEALDHSQANPDTSAADLRHAVENYAAALRGLADAGTQADNSANSSSQTAQHASNAAGYAGAVPGSPTSGHAGDNADKAEQEATAANGTALDSVAAGGPGSGESVQDPGDGAKEATLEKVLAALTGHSTPGTYTVGTANGGSAEKGNLTASITEGEAQIEAGKLELSNKITEIRSGLSAIGGNVDSGVGTLPVIDVGDMKGVHVSIDLNRNAEQLHVVSTIIIALAWLSAFSIVLLR